MRNLLKLKKGDLVWDEMFKETGTFVGMKRRYVRINWNCVNSARDDGTYEYPLHYFNSEVGRGRFLNTERAVALALCR
jgi:hypothetical protein